MYTGFQNTELKTLKKDSTAPLYFLVTYVPKHLETKSVLKSISKHTEFLLTRNAVPLKTFTLGEKGKDQLNFNSG